MRVYILIHIYIFLLDIQKSFMIEENTTLVCVRIMLSMELINHLGESPRLLDGQTN